MLERFFKARLTELGKLKIGGKGKEITSRSGAKFRQPLKLDRWIITTMQRDAGGNLEPDIELMRQLAEEYGSPADDTAHADDPGAIELADGLKVLRQIPIRLLSNDIEDVMQSAYVWYAGKSVSARSDGETITWFYDRTNGKRLPEAKTEPWDESMLELADSKGNKLLKLHTVFNCVIAAKEARWGGVYKFRTTSVITGKQLYGSLTQLLQLTGGVLIGMPLVLVVRPIQVTPDGKATTVYVVHVELRGPDLTSIQDQAFAQMQYLVANKERMQVAQARYKMLLVGPGEETTEAEVIDVEEEFHPAQPSKDDLEPPSEADPLLQPKEPSGAEAASAATAENALPDGSPDTQDSAAAIDSPGAAPLDFELEPCDEASGAPMWRIRFYVLVDGEPKWRVALHKDKGTLRCDCPAWIAGPPDSKGCPHVELAKERLENEQP